MAGISQLSQCRQIESCMVKKWFIKAASAHCIAVVCFVSLHGAVVMLSADVALVNNAYQVLLNPECGRTGRWDQVRLLLQADHGSCPSTAIIVYSRAESDLV